MLREAKGAWRYLRNKINDILDYVQIISGEFALHISDFSLRRFVKYLSKTTSFLLASKLSSVGLDFSVDPGIPDLYTGDRDRLEQVLFNFLSNAAKFTDKGKIALRVSAAKQEEDAGSGSVAAGLVFTVADTGCGMAKETVDSLFSLAHGQGNHCLRSMTAVAVGPERLRKNLSASATKLSGLGLTISKMICAGMGADIAVSSELGKGAEFSFAVPRSRRQLKRGSSVSAMGPREEEYEEDYVNDLDESVSPDGPTGNGKYRSYQLLREFPRTANYLGNVGSDIAPCSRRKKMAMVVDDNDFNRYVAQEMLKKFGFETVSAENGKVALEKLRLLQRDHTEGMLVFMDVDMPVMDGIEATVQIRKENIRPRPNIVALTAFSAESERRKCFEAGMDSFIDKPLTKERLCEFLQYGLQSHVAHRKTEGKEAKKREIYDASPGTAPT